VGAVEQQRRNGEPHVERSPEPARQPAERPAAAEHRRQRQLDPRQDLGQADGGHGEHEAGRPEETLDHQAVGQGPDDRRHDDAHGEGGVVVPVALLEQLGGQHARRRAQSRLGEVHDAAGPVDEHEAYGGEPGE
jgi:hypothetical protein